MIKTTAGEQCAIGAKANGKDRTGVAYECAAGLEVRGRPKTDAAIAARACQQLPTWAKRQTIQIGAQRISVLDQAPAKDIPQAKDAITASTRKACAIWAKDDCA